MSFFGFGGISPHLPSLGQLRLELATVTHAPSLRLSSMSYECHSRIYL